MRRIPPRLALLALAHFAVDAYSSFLSPLLPLLVSRLDLSLGRVGALAAIGSITSSLSQPLFGWIADRLRRPWFVALGPLLAAVFLSAVGIARSFETLAVLVALGGLGAAAFHPQGAALAGRQGSGRGFALSIFVTGGTLGFSLGPLLAVAVTGAFGLERSFLAGIPGVILAAFLVAWMVRSTSIAPHVARRPALRELGPHTRSLALLYLAVVVRSAVSYGFMTFLPIHLHREGYSVGSGGAFLTAYLGAGAVGGLMGGWLADRWGGRRIVIASFLGAAPLFLLFPFVPVVSGIALLALGNLLLQSSLPVNVVLGQELSPPHASTIASLLMGAAWGVGVLLASLTGTLADAIGLPLALLALAALLPLGFACALALPRPRHAAQPSDLAVPPITVER